ncbi:MAG TPA: LptF/LptG family permease [Methylomirabilota bacterium]|nr:LptF/LptG family permease [Methylomirabilota bacterium]
MRRPPLAVADRYLLRELAAPFGLGVALFTFFFVIDSLYELTELVITRGVPLVLVIQLVNFMLPALLSHTLPMALLVAVLLAGGRLAGDLEIVAFKAAGVSPLRLLRPVMLAALLITVTTTSLTLVVNPIANQQFQAQLFKILQSRVASALKERVFNTSLGDLVLYVEEISPSQVGIRGVLVSDERDPTLSRIVTAREGRIITDEANHRITLRLIDGGVNEADVSPADPPPGVVTHGSPTVGGAASAKRYRYTKFAVYDMVLNLESSLKSAASLDRPERDLRFRDLRRQLAEARPGGDDRRRLEIELHKRFAFPAAALVFALLGFPLAVRSHRGGRGVALVGTLVIVATYYLVLSSLEGVAQRGRLPVWLAVWAPNLGFGTVGGVLLLVATREWHGRNMRGLWRVVDAVWQRLPRPRRRREERATAARDTTLIIDRYLLRRYVGFVAIGMAVATTLIVVGYFLQTLDRYLRVKPPLRYIAEHLLYVVPVNLYEAVPIVMLVATVFLFLTLSRWHELTALKAAGISLYRVSAPVLAFGLVLTLAAGFFQEFVLPDLRERGDEVERVKIRGEPPRHLRSRTRLWLRSSDTRFYRVELLSPVTADLYGVTILEIDRDFRLLNRVDARRAHWTPVGWELSEGAFREIDRDGTVTTLSFDRTGLELSETIHEFTAIHKRPTAMNYRELREYLARLEATGFQVQRYLVEMYAKLSNPLRSLIMILLAIPFALQSPRGGRLYGIALAIGLMAAYVVMDYSARAFARADLLPPLLAAWTANVVFFGVGATMFLRART